MRIISFILFFCFFSTKAYPKNIEDITIQIFKIEDEINACKNINNVDCVKIQLLNMCKADQVLREYSLKCSSDEIYNLMSEQDEKNTVRLKKIIDRYFWVKISIFGESADNQAWLLAQHADHNRDFQHKILFILEKMVIEKETNPKHYAYLYDRLSVQYGKFGVKQIYGTQAIKENREIQIYPYEGTPFELDQRREKVGLSPIKEYMVELNRFYD